MSLFVESRFCNVLRNMKKERSMLIIIPSYHIFLVRTATEIRSSEIDTEKFMAGILYEPIRIPLEVLRHVV